MKGIMEKLFSRKNGKRHLIMLVIMILLMVWNDSFCMV